MSERRTILNQSKFLGPMAMLKDGELTIWNRSFSSHPARMNFSAEETNALREFLS